MSYSLGAARPLAGSLLIVLGLFSGDATAQGFLESPLAAANATTNTISTLGLDIDVSGVVMQTPGGIPLTLDDLAGAPLPGMLAPGYVGGTVFADVVLTATGVVATTVTVTMPETVLIGNVTQNDPGPGLEGRTFSIMGVEVRAAVDPRLDPFAAIVNSLPVDIASIPLGSIVAVEGYYGDDGLFYAQVLEAETGVVIGGPQVAIERARCNGTTLEARGAASDPIGTVEILDLAGNVLGSAPVDPADGTWRVRANACAPVIRARHLPSGAMSEPFAPAN